MIEKIRPKWHDEWPEVFYLHDEDRLRLPRMAQEEEDGGLSYSLADLADAIEYNSCPFDVQDITGVYMKIQGERDGDEWLWYVSTSAALRINYDAKSIFDWIAIGSCDYTGWDCRSSLTWFRRYEGAR